MSCLYQPFDNLYDFLLASQRHDVTEKGQQEKQWQQDASVSAYWLGIIAVKSSVIFGEKLMHFIHFNFNL